MFYEQVLVLVADIDLLVIAPSTSLERGDLFVIHQLRQKVSNVTPICSSNEATPSV